jgi:hypothetical protein
VTRQRVSLSFPANEYHRQIDVAVRSGLAARERTEQRQVANADGAQLGGVRLQVRDDLVRGCGRERIHKDLPFAPSGWSGAGFIQSRTPAAPRLR